MSLRNLTFVALLCAFTLNASLPTASAAERREPFELRDGDRVVLLGGTFFERAQRYGYLETALQLRFPDRKFSVRNLGWSGDTVFAESRGIFDAPAKGYARMIEQVKGLKPTVIFLHYGENEAFNGAGYLLTFVQQYEKLLDDLVPTGAQIVLFSPRPLYQMKSPLPSPEQQNRVRLGYSVAIQQIAARRQIKFVDLVRVAPIGYLRGLPGTPEIQLTDDGQQFNETGYSHISTRLAEALFGFADSSRDGQIEIDVRTQSVKATGCRVTLNNATSDKVSFTATLTEPFSSGADYVIHGLNAGRFELKINGTPVPLELTPNTPVDPWRSTIWPDETRVLKAVIEKNEMYFHRWRPQNVTYLFLFRKHEQGNNAKEVEEFEQIVAKLDDRIFELKQKAAEVTVEIVRVGDADSDK